MAKKTVVLVDGVLSLVDFIAHEGKAWLVPEWRLSPDRKSMQPVRIISLALAKGYKADLGQSVLAYFQSNLVPKSLLESGLVPLGMEQLLEVQEEPEIWLPNPEYSH